MHRREGLGGSLRISLTPAMTRTSPWPSGRRRVGISLLTILWYAAAPSYPWRQIHPQLHHFEHTAASRELATMKLFVDQGRKRRSSTAHRQDQLSHRHRRVPVCHFTLVDDGDRLEATMWVLADAAALVRRREPMGPA